nr:peroxiredoxin family protein [uncultured Flavobacterium sp.]
MKKIKEVNGLKVGEIAPNFTASDIYDNKYILSDALSKGEVVLIFIRGQWCPFCNKHLKEIQENLPSIYKKGATVVVVSPEKSEFIKKTIEKTGAEFTVLYDKDYTIAKAYDVLFKPKAILRTMYNVVLGAKLKESHSDDSEQLPVPATFIVSKDGKVKWRQFNPNYTKRSQINDILDNLN